MPIPPLPSSQTPVFLLNSRLGLFSAPSAADSCLSTLEGALLPKLRGNFAEFLSEGSLERLGIFYPPTCVGLRYGHPMCSLRGFSRQRGITQVHPYGLPHHTSAFVVHGFAYAPASVLGPEPSPGSNYPPASPLRSNAHKTVLEY